MAFPRTDYLRKPFTAAGFEEAAWQHAFHRHPTERVRRKLRVVRAFAQGQTMSEVAQLHHLQVVTVRKYVTHYIQEGFLGLCAPQLQPRAGRLTSEQEAAFRHTLLTSCPEDHGLVGRIWTGHLMRHYLLDKWNVVYYAGIYDVLDRLGLSHQKAHADYGNADPAAQRACLEALKDTLLQLSPNEHVVAFDEFSVCEKPTGFYGWAVKNTRPRFTTNEKKERASTAS